MPSQKKRPVTLTAADRDELVRVSSTGVHPASMIRRAGVLLALDTSVGVVDPKEAIAARLGVSGQTIRLVAKRFAETGGDCGHDRPQAAPVPAGALAGDRRGRGPVDRPGVLGPSRGVRPLVAAAAGEARCTDRRHPGSGSLHHRAGVEKTALPA